MTPQLLDFDAPVTRSRPRREKKSRTEMVIDYFEAHPGEWIDGLVFAEFAGAYAWRSRIADARKTGMAIDNRQRRVGDSWRSEYIYRPYLNVPTVSAREGE